MFTELIATTLIGGTAAYKFWILDPKKEREMLTKERLEKKELERRRIQRSAENFEDLFNEKYFSSLIMIDSAVWMSREAKNFFQSFLHLLMKHNKQIYMCTAQLNEIENKICSTKYGQNVNLLARMALNRIEKFQVEGRLGIGKLKIDIAKATYADEEILKTIKYMDKKKNKVTLITADRMLRIKARGFESNLNHEVVNPNELKNLYDGYLKHHKVSFSNL